MVKVLVLEIALLRSAKIITVESFIVLYPLIDIANGCSLIAAVEIRSHSAALPLPFTYLARSMAWFLALVTS